MTDRELKKLSRGDLLEMLLELTRENDQLRGELEQAKAQLADRAIRVENAGSLAEAALQLSGVFDAAQAACEQYSQNLRDRSEHQQERCDEQRRETEEKCARMVEKAKQEADAYWEYVRGQVRELYMKRPQED